MAVTAHETASELGWATWEDYVKQLEDDEFEKELIEIEDHLTDVWDD